MATRKNTRKSTHTATRQHGAVTRANFDRFVAENPDDKYVAMGGGVALMAWIVSLVREEERTTLAQVDAAIRYLDPSPAV